MLIGVGSFSFCLPELRRIQGQCTPPEPSDALTNTANRKLVEGQKVSTPAQRPGLLTRSPLTFCTKHYNRLLGLEHVCASPAEPASVASGPAEAGFEPAVWREGMLPQHRRGEAAPCARSCRRHTGQTGTRQSIEFSLEPGLDFVARH